MPLIKYYSINTCYDGRREFTKADSQNSGDFGRHYPDEYLIANILLKYQHKRYSEHDKKCNLVVLAEPWKGSICKSSTRDGGKNTLVVNDLVLNQIKFSQKEPKNTLILVPWLYGYHHPGITIDVQNKIAIYLDPYGTEAHYSEAVVLKKTLTGIGFEYWTVTTRQQTDAVNCGPILTGSMIKFIDEFMSSETVSVNGFTAPRPNLATDRLFQMYINNTVELDEARVLVDEIMLAFPSLWRDFLCENNVPESTSQSVLDAVALQQKAIDMLPVNWESNQECRYTVQFISNFQSNITEYVIARDSQLASKIETLVARSNQLFGVNGMDVGDDFNFDVKDFLSVDNHSIELDDFETSLRTQGFSVESVSANSLFMYPASYGSLITGVTDNLLKARAILDDYTKGDSAICRFFTGHWNRHHVAEVQALVLRIDGKGSDPITTVEKLLEELDKIELANPDGSLARRTGYITDYCRDTFESSRRLGSGRCGDSWA